MAGKVEQVKAGGHVVVADDHPLTREGLSLAARAAMPGSTTVGAGTVADAIAAVKAYAPLRMILLDFELPDANGYSGLMTLQHQCSAVPIVVVTAHEDPKLVETARALGAAGFLFKSSSIDEIAARLRLIDQGQASFHATAAASQAIKAACRRIAELSPAQHAVLMALVDGRANKLIARDLDVTEATVKAHLTMIYRKLGVANRTQALLAIQPLVGSLAR